MNGKMRHGRGLMYKDGNFFEGIFDNDWFIFGWMTDETGKRYQGPFVNDKLEGKECFFIGDSDIKGEFKEGKPDGVCLEKRRVKGERINFYGVIWDGNYQEYGILTRKNQNGTIYIEGEITNGLFNGDARYWTKDWETRYWGGFKDSQYTGQGKLVTPEYSYEGEFKSHKKDG
jgi:hypothetical protein